jgi:hypothetical protein
MTIITKVIYKATVKKSIAKKALKVAVPNLKAAFNFKTGKTVKNLLPVLNDIDTKAYRIASKANKRGLKQYGRVKKGAVLSAKIAGIAAVTGSGAMTANNFRTATPEQRQQAYDRVKNGGQRLAEGYKYVYGKVRRVRSM